MRFGCVLGDAEYGKVAEFRHALDRESLGWALGIPPAGGCQSFHVWCRTMLLKEPSYAATQTTSDPG